MRTMIKHSRLSAKPRRFKFRKQIFLHLNFYRLNAILQPEVKIRQLRELKGFSQEHVANRLGLSTKAYSNIENGQTQLTIQRLEEICDILEVSPTRLLEFDDRAIFDRCQFDNHSSGISNHYSSPTERQVYEDQIAHLKEEVKYLREQLQVLLGK